MYWFKMLFMWIQTTFVTLRLYAQLIVLHPHRLMRGSYHQAAIIADVFSEPPGRNEKWTDRGSTSAKCHQEAAHTHTHDGFREKRLVPLGANHTHFLTCLARWSRPPHQTFTLIRWCTLPAVLTVTVAHHCVNETKTDATPYMTTRDARDYV